MNTVAEIAILHEGGVDNLGFVWVVVAES